MNQLHSPVCQLDGNDYLSARAERLRGDQSQQISPELLEELRIRQTGQLCPEH
jgi:hypothetical protein